TLRDLLSFPTRRSSDLVLDRGANAGYVSFKNDANRMDALSTVFPVIFFLVAALVSLTTMTRMVEEERVIIGTYKALGYTRWRIRSEEHTSELQSRFDLV